MTGAPDPAAAHPLLVTTEWLAARIDAPDFVLVDAGEANAYRRAHLTGAVGLPHPYLKGDDSRFVMTADQFQTLARSLGVSNDTPVVIYDDNASLYAARVWWVFQHYGHNDVRVVDGGLSAWLDEGRPLTATVPRPDAGDFTASEVAANLCTLDDLRAAVDGDDAAQIWDTRSDDEWDGSSDRGNQRAGHVPGAVHLEWRLLMQGPPARRFRPLDEIRQALVDAGINPEAETVTY